MTSTIRTNMESVRNHNIFASNNAQMNKAMTHAATGMRLNSVQDSPSQWAISEKMRERINSLNQANRNVQNDTAMLKTAEGGINNTIDILRTLKARVINAADSPANDSDRQTIAKEIQTLFDQITYNAETTRYNGKLLLAPMDSSNGLDNGPASVAGSTSISLTFQIGADTGEIIAGVDLQTMTLKGLGLDTFTDGISSLQGSLDSGTVAILRRGVGGSADNFISQLDSAINTALQSAANVGSYEQRLGYTADNVATQIENLEASDSTIRDSDMAKEISEYMKWSVLSQASQYMLAQSNQNAFSVLNLLQ